MVVVSGSNAGAMAKQLADTLGWAHHPLETRRFPDTEGYIRIPTDTIEALREEPVVLVSNTFPDSGIVETLLMLDAIQDVRSGRLQNLREIGPQTLPDVGKGVILAVPYFGYSRQDKRFKPGESISARAIADMLATRCDGMVVLDLHAPAVLSDMSIPVAFTTAMPELAHHLKETVNPDFILSPTKGPLTERQAWPTRSTASSPTWRRPESTPTPSFIRPRTSTSLAIRRHRGRHDRHGRNHLPPQRRSEVKARFKFMPPAATVCSPEGPSHASSDTSTASTQRVRCPTPGT